MHDFVHLHLHSQYSLLDGAADISKVIKKAKHFGMDSIAITDHGVMYGVIDFYTKCKENSIKPIVGCEVYTAKRKHTDKHPSLDKHYGHLVLLCKNETGYQNLLKLVSIANTEGFYYKPRVDMELLRHYHEGLIALSGCLRGDVAEAFLTSGYDRAKQKALEFAQIFGKENFFLEIQNHGIAEEELLIKGLSKLSKEIGIGLVCTNDVHFCDKEDFIIQDVLTCIQTGKKLSDKDRLKLNEESYFKSSDEMYEIFKDYPDALLNTKKISDMCNLTIDFGKIHLPSINIDTTLSHEEYLRNLCEKSFLAKYDVNDDIAKKRLDYELSVISKMGYTDYFLIVYDFIKYSRNNNISVGPGRGSAAGSIVAYLLDITQIDPIKYNLLFERFLNPERISMPDIDIDFCYIKRDKVREYVTLKYGENKVSQIITFGTLQAKACVKDVGRVMGVELQRVNHISKLISLSNKSTLKDALEVSGELKTLYNRDLDIKNLIDISLKLEGFPRNVSTHAAGVVIGDDDLTKYCPLQKCETGILTQYPMSDLEKIGLLKMDFLALRNLTIIDDTISLIKKFYGKEINIEDIPLDDEKTFSLISSGDTDAVFQLENPGLQTFLKKFKPKRLEDIISTTSLYRPGPMEELNNFLYNVSNPDKITYKHPLLKPILEETYGVIIYQEQVMKIVRTLAGYSLSRADMVRRIMSKKNYHVMEKEREIFINGLSEDGKIVVEGCIKRGINKDTANEIFNYLIDFANYAFNKSHASCYALLAYRTAYLKAHYSVCYLSAVLKNYPGYINKLVKYLSSFSKYGIKLLPPDINKSHSHFIPEGNNIRFGLSWIKNVGEKFPREIADERKNGDFTSFDDFLRRMSSYDLSKRTLDIMIKCGVFDSIYPNRKVLCFNSDKMVDLYLSNSKLSSQGQLDWFSVSGDKKIYQVDMINEDISDYTLDEKINFEYEYSGVYFSGHPLDKWYFYVHLFTEKTIFEIINDEKLDGQVVKLCAHISSVNKKRTKSGKMLCSFILSDFTGQIKGICFEKQLVKYDHLLNDSNVLYIEAVVSKRENDETELSVNSVMDISNLKINTDKSLYIKLHDKNELNNIMGVIKKHSGKNKVYVYFEDSKTWVHSDDKNNVKITLEFLEELSEKTGKENIKFK